MSVFLESELTVLANPEALADCAAVWLLERVRARDRRANVCLSGGSNPRRLYETLAAPPYRETFPWDRVHWFWGDERFVPRDDPRSNYRMAREALLDRAPIPASHVHPIPTELPTPEAAAAAYEQELKRVYGANDLRSDRPLFDATLLGLGEDGHIASLFPGSTVLDERSRWVAAVAGVKPEARVTLTYPALESSRAVAFLVAGAEKRAILARLRTGKSAVPGARLAPLGDRPRWFIDRAAAGMPARSPARPMPAVVVVMGVSGAGKTTVGTLLAGRLHWEFEDGDWFHPAANIEKMRAGIPLTDEDRWPWLHAIAEWIDATRRDGGHGVVTCSALKRRYRALIIGDRPDVRLVYLKGDRALIARRQAAREGHFMPPGLLDSQFEALEEPGPDEDPIVVSIEPRPREIVEQIRALLEAQSAALASAPGAPESAS